MTSTTYCIIAWILLIPGGLTALVGVGFVVFTMLKDKEYGLVTFALFLITTLILSTVFYELYKKTAAEEKAIIEQTQSEVEE